MATTTTAVVTTTTAATTTTVAGPTPCPKGSFEHGRRLPAVHAGASRLLRARLRHRIRHPCVPGTFQDTPGQVACLLAPYGTYVPGIAAIAVILCPVGSTTLMVGSISPNDCV